MVKSPRNSNRQNYHKNVLREEAATFFYTNHRPTSERKDGASVAVGRRGGPAAQVFRRRILVALPSPIRMICLTSRSSTTWRPSTEPTQTQPKAYS